MKRKILAVLSQKTNTKNQPHHTMKRKVLTVWLAVFVVVLSVIISIGIGVDNSGDHEGEAKTPSGSTIQQGRNYEDVLEDFQEKGFTNITLEPLEDLITGWLTKDGEVESVSIDGDENYAADTWYPNDVAVIITYHTFPEVAENNSEDSGIKQESEAEGESTIETEATSDQPPKPAEPVNLTVENCAEFANILSLKSESDPAYAEFAKAHRGEKVEFDGCILNVMNHGNYNTRYDILLNAGNYVDANTANPGPYFKFEDVNTFDMGIKDLYLPSFAKNGSNVHIIAKVVKFDDNSGLFFLDPISVEER